MQAGRSSASCTFDLLLDRCCSCKRPKLCLMGCRVLSNGICCLAAAPCCGDSSVMPNAQLPVVIDCNMVYQAQCGLSTAQSGGK